ncbi:MAG: RNA polymerase sigma factor [Acidobacteria bacterium]|nr:RNA polymerase sigma factor [Acidobacteriota bacterium]
MSLAGGDPWAEDRALASRCVLGDEAAWSELVGRFGARIYSHCRFAGLRPADAEDVCQEVLVSAYRSLGSYAGCSLATWLYRLTRRRLADHFRSPQRRLVPSGDALAAADPSPGENPEAAAAAAADAARTRHALAALAEPARGILVAYYLYETPVREIAEELGMPVNTVKSHLHRGRRELRRRLEGRS